jgi:hypothetical protein
MQKLTILLIMVALLGGGWACRKPKVAEGTPRCITRKVAAFEKQKLCDKATVDEYVFQDKTVYLFNEGVCYDDGASEVVNSDCTSLGLLGGISGNMKINGEDFSKAVFVRTVWRK